MVKRFFSATLFIFFSILIFVWGCTKLDTTTLGTELIPEVDNVNTFADTLDITTTQGVFDGLYKDTTKLGPGDLYAIGKVNDPLMGETKANLFLQFKPPFYPYFIGKISTDTLVAADSVVLCLSYKTFWGDSLQPIKFQVYEVSHDAHGEWDSLSSTRDINFSPQLGNLISEPKSIDIRNISTSYIKVGKTDSVVNQIRIKLSDEFKSSLFTRDTSTNKSFYSDSLYKIFNNGFAVVATEGSSLLYVNLLETNTRLELHYKKRNFGVVDTVYNSFYFNSGLQGEIIPRSSLANQIVRDRSSITLPSGDQEILLQTTPGTFANLRIPALDTISNKIIHRAEIEIQQIPTGSNDLIYTAPPYMYLDLVDSGLNKWKPIYYDLNPSAFYDPDYTTGLSPFFPANGTVDNGYFGGYLRTKYGISGQQNYYTFNVTRYVQQLATKHTMNYNMRMFPAQSFIYPQYSPIIIPYKNPIAFGSIKVGGGGNSNPSYRMRMRIIYSKIK